MTFRAPPRCLKAQDQKDLCYAKSLLEKPGFAARLANLIGIPIEKGFKLLPAPWARSVNKATRIALTRALQLAVSTLGVRSVASSNLFHKVIVGASGGIGGAFGLPALALELPVSTTIILRSIADIARSEGHDPRELNTRLACLEVFALGGKTTADDRVESSYWTIRAALGKAVSEAAAYLAQKGLLERSAPAVVRLISAISSRFGVIVSEQVAAKAIPVVGAVGGGVINVLFIDHFQDMARGHFIIKRLEKEYGTEVVQRYYEDARLDSSGPTITVVGTQRVIGNG